MVRLILDFVFYFCFSLHSTLRKIRSWIIAFGLTFTLHFQKADAFLSFRQVCASSGSLASARFTLRKIRSWIIAFGLTFTLHFQKADAFLSFRQVCAFSGSLASARFTLRKIRRTQKAFSSLPDIIKKPPRWVA